MTLLDLIAKGAPALANLKTALVRVRAASPDLGPTLDPMIAALDAAADPAGLVALGQTVVAELAALPGKGLDPRPHPSDLA